MAKKRTFPRMTLRAFLCCLMGLTALTGPAGRAETAQPLPTPFPQARYRQMSAKSPFAVASAAAAPTAAPTPGFAAQLYVDGVAHKGKTDFVAIKSRDPDSPNLIFLEVGKSTPDGLKAERVNWAAEMGKSTVDVSKGGEKATLEFDEATVKSTPANGAPNQPPGSIRMPMLPGQGRPMNFPMQGGPPVFNRFNPQQPALVQPPPGSNVLTPAMIDQQRRRVRGIIQSGQ